jgi:uncharacterized protein (TIGR03790 family)
MIFCKTYFFSLCIVFGILISAIGCSASSQADRVIILVNSNDSGSLQIAEYYANARGIPMENIVKLDTSKEETISIREYVDTIHNPLLNALLKEEWIQGVKASGHDGLGRERLSVAVHSISYLVATRGIPLRIANDPTLLEVESLNMPKQFHVNQGSVDGELALLAGPSNLSMTAFVQNPLFSQDNPVSLDSKRVIRVSRLDGPTPEVVIKLIDRSLEAEETGLIGRAYFDLGGPHSKGDEWINAAGDLAVKAFFDADFEQTKRLMGYEDRYDAPAIYMGWYGTNAHDQWRAKRWMVPPGAIAFHLHSFSATTVRSTSQGWLGAFVNQGYCATVGNTYEPYLEYTHRPQLLLAHLLEGHTFGEAAMYSNPTLSWQGVAIGDPLYRPFKVGLDEQLEQGADRSLISYISLRQMNRLKSAGKIEEALAYGRSQFVEQPSLSMAYKLAQIYANEGDTKRTIESLKVIRYITVFAPEELILAQKIADLLNKQGESDLALEVYKQLIDQAGSAKNLQISLLEGGSVVALAAGDSSLSSRWTLNARQLQLPPAKRKPSKG